MARTTVERAAANIQKFERGMGRFGRKVLLHEAERTVIPHIKRTKFKSGGRPNPRYIVNRSGRLMRSLRARVRRASARRVEVVVAMSGPQATTLEDGRRRTVVTVPKRKSILRWEDPDTGRAVFARRVVQRPSSFTPRKVLARGVEEKGTQVVRNVERALLKEWERRIAS